MKKLVTYCLVLVLMLCGCRSKKVVEQRRSVDSIRAQSIDASSVTGFTKERSVERVVVVSVMEIDTATGVLRETSRTTTTETTTSNEVEKTENQAQNNAVEAFSVESDIVNSQTTENGSNGLKTGFRIGWQTALFFIAAIVVVAVFLWLKWKRKKILKL